MDILIAILVVVGIVLVMRKLEQIEGRLGTQLTQIRLHSEEEVDKRIKELVEEQKVALSAISAYSEALTRIDDFEEIQYLKYHYDAIRSLYVLRARGISEENIVKHYMVYTDSPFGGSGWNLPYKNERTGEYERHRISPYYLATHKVEIRNWAKWTREAAEESKIPGAELFGIQPDLEWPDSRIVEYPVTYKNDKGEYVTYPEHNQPA